jgi:hypothetical protein
MKNKFLLIFLLFGSILAYGQNEFRPIIDTTIACSYHSGSTVERYYNPNAPTKYDEKVISHMELFYIVEKMPIPEIKMDLVEKVLEKDVQLIKAEKTLEGDMYFQCIVNCKGKAGDFQIVQCPDGFSNICCQVFEKLHENFSKWQPGKQKDNNVDMLIKIHVNFQNGKFKVIAPIY